MNNQPDLEKILEVICANIKSTEDKAIVETYFRNRDALTPEYREKATARIKEALSEYPELKQRNTAEELGITEEELITGYKNYKEMKKQLGEAKERLEKYKEPDFGPIDNLSTEENLETVNFHGQELVKSEYEALQELAQKYFNKTAEEYFANLKDPYPNVFLHIRDKRVLRLYIKKQGLKEIPKQIQKFTKLLALWLPDNQI